MKHSDHHHHTHDGWLLAAKAAAGDAAVVRDPVCGMTVDPAAGKPTSEHGGRLYHFCSERCRTKFDAEPDKNILSATDPVCGMTVDRATARHFVRHEGQGFYFCSAGCKAKFEAEPQKYLGDRPHRSRCPRARNTPARCIPKSSATNPAPARNAAWRWSRWAYPPAMRGQIPSWSISPGGSGSVPRCRCRC